MAELPTWENSIFAKILKDAAAAVAAQTVSARQLWADVFGDASTWLDTDAVDQLVRPTEHAAIRNVFWQARNAQSIWTDWLNARDAALYGTETAILAENIPYIAAQTAREEAARAKVAANKAIKRSQQVLPGFAAQAA